MSPSERRTLAALPRLHSNRSGDGTCGALRVCLRIGIGFCTSVLEPEFVCGPPPLVSLISSVVFALSRWECLGIGCGLAEQLSPLAPQRWSSSPSEPPGLRGPSWSARCALSGRDSFRCGELCVRQRCENSCDSRNSAQRILLGSPFSSPRP